MGMDSLALFDLVTLKRHLKLDETETSRDAELEVLGHAASAYCEDRVGERFKVRSYSLVRNGDGTSKLLRLPRPIVAITSLTIDDVAVESSDYVVFADAGKLQLKTKVFGCGVGNVVLALDAGYPANHPRFRQVLAAALDLAKSHYDEWDANAIAASSVSIGPQAMVIKPGLNPRIEKYLDALRDVRV